MKNLLNSTLVGAGRYGNGLVGQKYIKNRLGSNINSVIDPNINILRKRKDFHLNNIPSYKNAIEWSASQPINQNTVVDLALKPEIIPRAFKEYIDLGVRKIILPKPVSYDLKKLDEMKRLSQQYDIKTAVTSNWHYSKVTRLTKIILNKILGKNEKLFSETFMKNIGKNLIQIKKKDNLKIKKVRIVYNKNRQVYDDTTPVLCEFPHVLQILSSTGLMDFNKNSYKAKITEATKTKLALEYTNVRNISDKVEIETDLNYIGDKISDKKRLLEIYLNDDKPNPAIIVDYNVMFDSDGICIKPATINVDIQKNEKNIKWAWNLEKTKEDNLESMYKDIFRKFNNTDNEKYLKNRILTLENYIPIAKEVSKIQRLWKRKLTQTRGLTLCG